MVSAPLIYSRGDLIFRRSTFKGDEKILLKLRGDLSFRTCWLSDEKSKGGTCYHQQVQLEILHSSVLFSVKTFNFLVIDQHKMS